MKFFAVFAIFAFVSCGHPEEEVRPKVRLAVGGQNQMVYLPTTLAQELGYYKDEGLDVELQDHAGGATAITRRSDRRRGIVAPGMFSARGVMRSPGSISSNDR